MSSRDVAVVGMACVFPGARDVGRFWRNVVSGRDSIGEVPDGRWPGSRLIDLPPEHEGHVGCRRGGFVDTPYLFDPVRHKVMPKVARFGDVDQFILLDVLSDALDDAGIAERDPRRAATDVILGRGNYTSNKMLEVFLRSDGCDRIIAFLEQRLPQLSSKDLADLEADLRASLPPRDPDGMATAITNLTASRAANRLDLGGSAFVVDAACASSLVAVELGIERLREGKSDVVIAAGINFTNVPGFWYLFSQLGAFSPTGQIRPFDRRADGILIGEGAGAVVLERADDARRAGHRVYALVKGVGSASDGRAAGVLAPSSGGQVRALERAYEDAGLDPETIGLLEAHGTGTPTGDRVEIETVRRVFGPPVAGIPTRVMGSVKSMIGHAMPAAGIASLIKVAMALTGKVLPPSLHCEQPDEALSDLAFFVTPSARPWLHDPDRGPRRAAVNAFGFGGINAHAILEEVRPVARETRVSLSTAAPTEDGPELLPRPVRPGLDPPTELLLLSASDRGALSIRMRQVATFLREEQNPFDLADLAFSLAAEADTHAPCRLALVRGDTAGLAEELDELATRVSQDEVATDDRRGIFFGESEASEEGHIAAVFPGIGFPGLTGDFPDHLLANCMQFPEAREAFDRVEQRDRHPEDPIPTSLLLVPPPVIPEARRAELRNRFAPAAAVADGKLATSRPDQRNLSHVGTLVNNWANWKILEGLGIKVDMLCGQSLGDLSAVLSAGMVGFEESIPNFWKTFNLEVPYVGSGTILMVGATEEQLAPLLAKTEDVSIALHLSPSVQVVGGSSEGVDRLGERLREERIFSQKLPFPPIHTPRLLDFQEKLTEAIGETVPLRPARIRIYSAVLAAPMPDDPEEVTALLRSNVSRPIRFWQTQRRMVEDGARFIVQIGSGTLAASSRTVLEGQDVVCMATDVGDRHPVTQIERLCAQLFASGLQLDPTALFASRDPRRLELAAPRPAAAASPTAMPLTLYWPPLYAPDLEPREPAVGRRPHDTRNEATPGALPFLGEVEQFEPGRNLVTVKRLTLDEHLYLADHVFLNLGDVKPLEDRGAVMPLTFTLEMLAENAAPLAPGLGLIGLERVRATRWIGFDGVDEIAVRIECAVHATDGDRVTIDARASVAGEPVARSLIQFAPHYRQTVDLTFHEPTNARAFPRTAREVYAGRHFFHGPRFHCVESLDVMSDHAATGRMVVRPAGDLFRSTRDPQLLLDPVALDGAGQIVGAYFLERDISLLPVSVDKIELYRPTPPAGARTPVHAEFTEVDLDGRRSKANIEVQDGSGHVWFRVVGWQDVLYLCSPAWNESQRRPDLHTLSTPRPVPGAPADVVVTRVTRDAIRHVPPGWLARCYLDDHEESHAPWGAEQEPGRWTSWLLGRVAAKDAARRWRAKRTKTSTMVHPAAVRVSNDAEGRPRIDSMAGDGPRPSISLAHTERGAVAVAADRPVGIDLEEIEAGARLTPEDFATDAERALLSRLADEPAGSVLTRLWCAKEAAGKTLGTGLAGRPKELEAVALEPDGRFEIRHRPTDRRVEVWTETCDGSVVAVAAPARVVTGPSS